MQKRERTARADGRPYCPMSRVQRLVSGKWKLLVLWRLNGGVKRFNELRRMLPRVSQRVLAQQLRELETEGLVRRKIYLQVPPRVEYSLTATGRSFLPIMQQMCVWGQKHLE